MKQLKNFFQDSYNVKPELGGLGIVKFELVDLDTLLLKNIKLFLKRKVIQKNKFNNKNKILCF